MRMMGRILSIPWPNGRNDTDADDSRRGQQGLDLDTIETGEEHFLEGLGTEPIIIARIIVDGEHERSIEPVPCGTAQQAEEPHHGMNSRGRLVGKTGVPIAMTAPALATRLISASATQKRGACSSTALQRTASKAFFAKGSRFASAGRIGKSRCRVERSRLTPTLSAARPEPEESGDSHSSPLRRFRAPVHGSNSADRSPRTPDKRLGASRSS